MKILVVDDEQLLVKGMKFNLENEGYTVETAYDGATAIDMAKSGGFDLIILDLMMPQVDGLVNVNTATAEELETLTGIGPSLAQAIIDYRAEHGDFTAAEDLLNVKGIGEAKLEGFRAEITFTEENGDENSGG